MTTEELKVKVSLETTKLKQELKNLKSTFKELKLDSKNKQEADELNRSLEKVERTVRDIDRIDIGDNLTKGLNKAKNKAKEVASAVSGIGVSSKIDIGVDGASGANADMKELQDTIESLKNLTFFDMVTDNLGRISKILSVFKRDVGDTGTEIAAVWELIKMRDWGTAFRQGFTGIFDQMKLTLENLKDGFTELFRSVIPKGAGKVVAVLAGVVAAVIAVKNALNQAKEVAAMTSEAAKIGMTTADYGEWQYIAGKTGIDADDFRDFIKTLSAAQNDVRSGSADMIAAFERLGMSVEEIHQMDQTEMFENTIRALQNVKSEVERTALAYKIFGEDDAAKISVLLRLNNEELERMTHNYYLLGGAMSGELIKNSKTLTGALRNLSVAWVGLKNTLAEVFLPIIIHVVQWLTKAVAVVNMFIRAIFGKEIVTASSGINNVSTAYTGYTDSANKATNATNKVTEAVERLKRVTMGFDELNKLPGVDRTPGSSSSGDTGTSGSGLGQLPTGSTGGLDLPTAEDLGLDGIADWITKNKQAIQDMAAILLTFGGLAFAVISILSGNLVGAAAGFAVAGVGIAIGAQDGGLWGRMFDGIKGVWENVKTWFNEHVKPVFTKQYWSDKWNSFTDGAKDAWDKFKQSPAGQFFAGIGNKVVELKAKFVEIGSNVRKTVSSAWSALKNKTATLTSKFKDGYYNTRKRLTDAWGKLKSKTATLTGKFKRSGYYETLNKYWDKFKTKTSTLTVAFKDAFTSKIKAAWNGLVKAINKAITTINKIPGVNIPKLPQLATGGIVTGPTTALIGEAGKEAVLPLERNTGWMDALADKIAAKNGSNNNAPSKIVLTVDGKQLGWATIDNINSITKQTGVLPLNLV